MMHHMDRIIDLLILPYKDLAHPIRPSTPRQRRVPDRAPRVHRHDGVQAQHLVEAVLQVGTVFEVDVRQLRGVGVRAEGGEHGVAQSGVHVRVAGERVEHPAQEGGRGVAAGEHDIQELGAQLDRVAGFADKGVEKDVAILLGGDSGSVVLFREVRLQVLVEREVDKVVDEGMARLVARPKIGRVHQPVVVCQPAARREPAVRAVEAVRELCAVHVTAVAEGGGCRVAVEAGDLRAGRLAEEELARRVQRQPEEEHLQVEFRRPAVGGHRQRAHHVLDVLLLEIQIRDLVARELRAHQPTRMLPALAVIREDAVAEQWAEVLTAPAAELEVVELRRQQGLDVLRVRRHVAHGAEHFGLEREHPSEAVEARGDHPHELLGAVGAQGFVDAVEPVGEAVGEARGGLAAEAGGVSVEATFEEEGGEEVVDDVGGESPNEGEKGVVHS